MLKKPPFAGTVVRSDGIYSTIMSTGVRTVYSAAPTLIETGSWSSVKTPGFKSMKPRNRPNNAFSASLYREIRKTGYQRNGIVAWDGYLDDFKSGTRFSLPTISSLGSDAQARSKLLTTLKSSSVNLAQAFSERKQTVDMLSKTVNRLASAALAIRHGNLRHASNLFGLKYGNRHLKKEIAPSPKNLANYWLEYSYGWRPLVSDIYGSMETLARTYYEKRPTVVRVRSLQSKIWKDYTLFFDSNYGMQEILTANNLESTSYVVEFVEDSSFCQAMSSVGLTNPALLAWELIPYSFVIDWIVPVGNYLGNLDATVGLSFVRGTKTIRQDFEGTSTWKKYKAPLNANYLQTGMGRSFYSSSKTRSVLTSFPLPVLEINPHIGVSRALSGLALLTQAFKR